MAQFLKIPLTGVANTPEILVATDKIIGIRPGEDSNPATNPTTHTTILFGQGTGFNTLEITHTPALVAGDVLAAFNAALAANPGGIVSTVGQPVETAQVPAAGVGGADGKGPGGRTVVTTAQVNVTFTDFLYA